MQKLSQIKKPAGRRLSTKKSFSYKNNNGWSEKSYYLFIRLKTIRELKRFLKKLRIK